MRLTLWPEVTGVRSCCGDAVQDDPRWSLADPICTFVFAALVLLTTRAILRDISDILMERVPRSQDAEAITAALFAVGHALLMGTGCMAHLTLPMHIAI